MRPSTTLPAYAIALLLLSTSTSSSSARATPVASSNAPKEQRFLRFESYKIEAGSIINVPVQCPPDKVKVGNRCRSVF